MKKQVFLFVVFLVGFTSIYCQIPSVINQTPIAIKNPIADFNLKRAGLSSNTFEDLIIEKLNSESELGIILDYLDKLDDKIVKLVYTSNQKKLRVFYSTSITVLDIMQGLKGIDFPAYFIATNGDHAYVDEFGSIELIQMKK